MGRDKTTVRMGDRLLVTRVYDAARMVFDRIIVVSSRHAHLPGIEAPVIPDALPQKGPIVGIVSALLYAATPLVFVLASDMPFIREDVLRFMVSQAEGQDIVIPRTDKGYEPLHAIYNRACISPLLTVIERGRLRIPEVFPYVRVRFVEDPQLFGTDGVSVFTNVNTEEELARARDLS